MLEKRLTGFSRGGGVGWSSTEASFVEDGTGAGRCRRARARIKIAHTRHLSAMIARPVFGGGDVIGGSATPSSSDAPDAVSSSSSDGAAASHL